jgi:hypothetical protein
VNSPATAETTMLADTIDDLNQISFLSKCIHPFEDAVHEYDNKTAKSLYLALLYLLAVFLRDHIRLSMAFCNCLVEWLKMTVEE